MRAAEALDLSTLTACVTTGTATLLTVGQPARTVADISSSAVTVKRYPIG